MKKKYELILDDFIQLNNVKLYRIRALKSFGSVKEGELGGYVESENNLSHSSNAWVGGNACVRDNAWVTGNGLVTDNACVTDNSRVTDNACVTGNACLRDNAWVSGNACVTDEAIVKDNTYVTDNAHISDWAIVLDRVWVTGDAQVTSDVRLAGNAFISGDARIESNKDYCVFKNTWSSGRWFTYTRSNKMWLVGCFYGTGEELIAKAYSDSELSGKSYELFVNLVREQEKLVSDLKED